MTARERVGELGGAGGELTIDPLAKLGGIRKLVQAAPILRAGFRFRDREAELFSSVTSGAAFQ